MDFEALVWWKGRSGISCGLISLSWNNKASTQVEDIWECHRHFCALVSILSSLAVTEKHRIHTVRFEQLSESLVSWSALRRFWNKQFLSFEALKCVICLVGQPGNVWFNKRLIHMIREKYRAPSNRFILTKLGSNYIKCTTLFLRWPLINECLKTFLVKCFIEGIEWYVKPN